MGRPAGGGRHRYDRSQGKLGAYQAKGGAAWNAARDEGVLYLGAAQGVGSRYLAKLVPQGRLLAVEKSAVAALGLLKAAEYVENIVPFVGDARRPSSYAPLVPELGLLYQDVAQSDQVDIFLRNARAFRPRRGFLAVKARSIAVERPPQEVFEEAAAHVQSGGGDVVDVRVLDPYHKDHAMIVADFQHEA